MAATKIILKRSSIPGKRPNTSNLEAGELAVNTNANEPGIFFEVTDGKVVKAGPTAYLPEEPTTSPARGELWLNTNTKSLSIGNNLNHWQKVAAPFLGGTEALTVYVAPDFPEATDSLANDGQAVPFVTINRAIIEVTKYIIRDALNGLNSGNNRYLIVLAPGTHCVINGPGNLLSGFSVNFNDRYQSVTQSELQQFNVPTLGGLILPRGVSVIGMDLKKSQIRPVYVPTYTHPTFGANYQQVTGGVTYANQPLSSIFKWSGNSYLSNFSTLDKEVTRVVDRVRVNEANGVAIFGTNLPHGLNYNDFVKVNFTNTADQKGATFVEGTYYAYPVNSFEFEISATSWDSSTALGILGTSLPSSFLLPANLYTAKFNVSNIYPYYVPEDGITYELANYSHHRLSVAKNCTVNELNEFYSKVQSAFSTFFGGAVNRNVATLPEYQIVADAQNLYPDNLSSNSVGNGSPYLNQFVLLSNYGMSCIDADGEIISGFKSVIVNEAKAVVLQKDPCAYETYADSNQIWQTLTTAAQAQWPTIIPVYSVPTEFQLAILNQTALPNVRYFYKTLLVADTIGGGEKDTGLTDINNDFRHFGFRVRGSNSYMGGQSLYTIGAAIGVWAMGGATINLTNSTTNFGSNAFQSEGFSGIGTLGGSTQVGQGFTHSGTVLPLALTEPQVTSDFQKRILSLGSRVIKVEVDPTNSDVTLVYLHQPFDPATILPFSLKPGSAVFFGDTICTYVAYFVDDGGPTCILSDTANCNLGAILRLRSSDANISADRLIDTVPYIRRFIDPRTDSEKSYGFYIQSTNPSARAPQYGSVLRLNQTGKNLSTTLKRNYQFDPGQFGGISQIFTVAQTETIQYNMSLNFNNKVSDASQSTAYSVYATLGDNSGPWVQSVPLTLSANSPYLPLNTAEGTYLTENYRNYYAAENNLWSALYYQTTFNPINGPTKVAPQKPDSPFVACAVLDKQGPIREAWQGYVPDPLYSDYTNANLVPTEYSIDMTYLRGTVVPNKEFAGEYFIDGDDGSPSMGIIFYTIPVPSADTKITSASKVLQTAQAPTSPYVTNPTFGRPEILSLSLLRVSQLENPRNGISVVQVTDGVSVEYLRVINITSNVIAAIRNYYPEYAVGPLPTQWPAGTKITPCVSSLYPQPSVYDPDWTITKSTVLRYYELMGFARILMAPYLLPQFAGERVLLNSSLNISPINGYSNKPAAWPVEFNNPSTIISNTHTWTYAGYLDYSRGLPKYQTNLLSRKISADFQSYGSFGGNVSCFGANDSGEIVLSGSLREAFTLNYFQNNTPVNNNNDKVLFPSPVPINYPSPVLVYSTDDITSEFSGTVSSFALTRGGLNIPASQLTTQGVFVFLGGAAQLPGVSYTISGNTIIFTEPPLAGTCCDIRVITTDDQSETLEVVPFTTGEPFDGVNTNYALSPNEPTLGNGNSLVFLGGVLQDPVGPPTQTDFAYTIDHSQSTSILSFIGGAPQKGTTIDVRGILSGSIFRLSGVPIVFMTSTDELSGQFDGARTAFDLTLLGKPLNPYVVNAENILVNLGGVMQIPIANSGSKPLGSTYVVEINSVSQTLQIIFDTPPTYGTTCNVRVISQEETITCPLPELVTNRNLKVGPGVEANAEGQLIGLDEGFV